MSQRVSEAHESIVQAKKSELTNLRNDSAISRDSGYGSGPELDEAVNQTFSYQEKELPHLPNSQTEKVEIPSQKGKVEKELPPVPDQKSEVDDGDSIRNGKIAEWLSFDRDSVLKDLGNRHSTADQLLREVDEKMYTITSAEKNIHRFRNKASVGETKDIEKAYKEIEKMMPKYKEALDHLYFSYNPTKMVDVLNQINEKISPITMQVFVSSVERRKEEKRFSDLITNMAPDGYETQYKKAAKYFLERSKGREKEISTFNAMVEANKDTVKKWLSENKDNLEKFITRLAEPEPIEQEIISPQADAINQFNLETRNDSSIQGY